MLTTLAFFGILFAVAFVAENVVCEIQQYLCSVSDDHASYTREDAIAEAKKLNASTSELWSIRRVSRFNSQRYYVYVVR